MRELYTMGFRALACVGLDFGVTHPLAPLTVHIGNVIFENYTLRGLFGIRMVMSRGGLPICG